jgi:hypothetical protein
MKYLYILISVLISFSASGQADLLEKFSNRYIYKDRLYKCDELGEIYETHQESLDLYLSGRKNKNTARTVSILGLPFIAGGILGVASNNVGARILGALFIIGGVGIELISFIPRGIGNRKLRMARSKFNFEMIRRHGYKEDVSLTFSQTPNGVGFVLNF